MTIHFLNELNFRFHVLEFRMMNSPVTDCLSRLAGGEWRGEPLRLRTGMFGEKTKRRGTVEPEPDRPHLKTTAEV
jgi:hypothetical protein